MTQGTPTAAPAHFPYAHRTLAEVPPYRPLFGGTMLAKGWAVPNAKLRIEPLPVWNEISRNRIAARYKPPLYFVSVP